MDEQRQLLRERLLRNARFGIGLHLLLEFGDLLQGLHREDLEVANHIRIRRAEEVLVPVVDGRHLAVQEERIALRLAELLSRRIEEQRKRQAERRLAAHLVHEIGTRRDVAPLVGAADFHLAAKGVVEMQEVVALEDLIAELCEGQRAVGRLETLLHALLREHLRHAEVDRDVTQELNRGGTLVPIVVVDEDRGIGTLEVEHAGEILTDALLVLLDLLDRQHIALGRLAGRIANQTGRSAHQCDDLVSGHLETLQNHDGNEVAGLQRTGGRIESAIHRHRLLKGLFNLRIGQCFDQPTCLQLFNQFHRRIL